MIDVDSFLLFFDSGCCRAFGWGPGFNWKSSNRLISASQHFAGGIVIAAICVELMPKLLSLHSLFAISAGFIIGVVALLYLVIEELISEAHETKDSWWITAMFF